MLLLDEAKKRADEIRDRMERELPEEIEERGSLVDYFEGQIYGETAEGGWIIGCGVNGSANIVLTPERVYFGDGAFEPFTAKVKAILEDFLNSMKGEKVMKLEEYSPKTRAMINRFAKERNITPEEVVRRFDELYEGRPCSLFFAGA